MLDILNFDDLSFFVVFLLVTAIAVLAVLANILAEALVLFIRRLRGKRSGED